MFNNLPRCLPITNSIPPFSPVLPSIVSHSFLQPLLLFPPYSSVGAAVVLAGRPRLRSCPPWLDADEWDSSTSSVENRRLFLPFHLDFWVFGILCERTETLTLLIWMTRFQPWQCFTPKGRSWAWPSLLTRGQTFHTVLPGNSTPWRTAGGRT